MEQQHPKTTPGQRPNPAQTPPSIQDPQKKRVLESDDDDRRTPGRPAQESDRQGSQKPTQQRPEDR